VKKIVFNRNIAQFTPEQQQHVNSELARFNHVFGYSDKLDPAISAEDLLQNQ
jgi:hypothetical protein